MKKITIIASVLFVVFLFSGCASIKSTKNPKTNLGSLKIFYVQKLPADNRGVEKLISERLETMGFISSYGPKDIPPQPVDAIVTYQDNWMWDITMYMIKLQIQIRDGKNWATLATGKAYRPSLQRKSPNGMVDEVLSEIFRATETVQMASSPKQDINSNFVTIILKRPSAMIAAFNSVPVYDDGKLIGKIANGGELKWKRPEGVFNLSIVHDAFQDSEINEYLKVSKGKVYTFKYKFNSLFGPSKIEFVQDDSNINPIMK